MPEIFQGIDLTPALTFSELREKNVARCEEVFHPLDEWSVNDWATAMGGEAGECLNKCKKLRRLDGADKKWDSDGNRHELKMEIAEEAADAVIYADLLLARIGMSLEEAIILKFNKVSKEKFSEHYL